MKYRMTSINKTDVEGHGLEPKKHMDNFKNILRIYSHSLNASLNIFKAFPI